MLKKSSRLLLLALPAVLLSSFAAAAEMNPLAKAVVAAGAPSCAARVDQVSNYLGFSAEAGALLFSPAAPANQRQLAIAIELPVQGSAAYASTSFAPNQANGCGATYDAVVYWAQSCDKVGSKQFAAFKKTGVLKKNISILNGGDNAKVFLMPAGSGCVSIKKEVVL